MTEFEITNYIIVPDTNVLYTKKPNCIVSPKFTDILNEIRSNVSIELYIPEAVKNELIFQQLFIGQKARENAIKSLSTISDVSSRSMPGLPTDKTLKNNITNTYDSWVKQNNAKTIKTPIKSIDLNKLINDALFRNPPFEKPSEPGDNSEKGFRDAIILETLKYIWSINKKKYVVFLCKDGLLYAAALKLGKKNVHLLFKTIDGFQSYLSLIAQEKSKKFVSLVSSRAPIEFWNSDDKDNVYNKFNIWTKIKTQYSHILDMWMDVDKPIFAALTGITIDNYPNTIWRPVGEDKVYVDRTEFDHLENRNLYHWKTYLSIKRYCQPQSVLNPLSPLPSGIPTVDYQTGLPTVDYQSTPDYFALPPPLPVWKMRTAKFLVVWSAKISSKGIFSNHKLEKIDFIDKTYGIAGFTNK